MKQFLYFIVAVLLISCSSKQDANPVETAVHYIDYVNPIIGTNGMGHTFPGACAPYGIVQLSPDTDTIPVVKDGHYHAFMNIPLGISIKTAPSWVSAIPISAARAIPIWAIS